MRRKKYDVERGLISKLIQTKNYGYVQDQQVKSAFFSGSNYYVFKFIEDYFIKHSEVPTERVIGQKYPEFEFETIEYDGLPQVGTEESLSHWCAEIRIKAKQNAIAEAMEVATLELNNFKTDAAFDKLREGIYRIENEVVFSTDVDITKDAQKRKEAYKKRKEVSVK